MKHTKLMLSASAVALTLGLAASQASATCYDCNQNAGATFDYSSNGQVGNTGSTNGDSGHVWSKSNKDLDGAGDTYVNSLGIEHANADSSVDLSTVGEASASGDETAGTLEVGGLSGGGMAATENSWGDNQGRYSFGVGGDATNTGNADGDWSDAQSDASKLVYGSGEAAADSWLGASGEAMAGAHFGTDGRSTALSGAWNGTAAVETDEFGLITGDGATSAGVSYDDYNFDTGSTFRFGAGGEANNKGTATGDLAGSYSKTTKDVYAGGNGFSNTSDGSMASGYSGSKFATKGWSKAISGGLGSNVASTFEQGSVMGGGSAGATASEAISFD